MAQGTSLSADAIVASLRERFSKIEDFRNPARIEISMADCVMSAYAIFAMKFPSLLNFEKQMKTVRNFSNLQSLFKVERIPSDTRMREVVDEVDPEHLRPAFSSLFRRVQSANVLKDYKSINGSYLLSVDGTGYFSSDAVSCVQCLERKTTDEDKIYHHQTLSGAIVHPDKKQVIPVCPEAIKKQDGASKNDSERAALRRFLIKFREDHPKLKTILLADALHSTLPMISELEKLEMNYITSVKPGSHETLFNSVAKWTEQGKLREVRQEEMIGDKVKKKRVREYRFTNGILLRASDVTKAVNYLDFVETTTWIQIKKGKQKEITKRVHYSWITDLSIYDSNCEELARAGRTRWKIENETFNTLKNQGYKFEHNFGHGNKHLSTNMIYLMLLAFLSDQIQALGCPNFKKAYKECAYSTLIYLWEHIKSLYTSTVPVQVVSFEMLFGLMLEPEKWIKVEMIKSG
jgi:hypothetical protein